MLSNKNILKLFFLIIFISQSFVVRSQSKTNKKIINTNFKVLGNCGMCEKKIEAAALNLKGVKKAVWDMDLLLLHVNYNSKKVNLTEIKQAIADAGYDTETIKTSDEKYNNLHYCCKYDRNQ
jgi:copper chaperone CopZ